MTPLEVKTCGDYTIWPPPLLCSLNLTFSKRKNFSLIQRRPLYLSEKSHKNDNFLLLDWSLNEIKNITNPRAPDKTTFLWLDKAVSKYFSPWSLKLCSPSVVHITALFNAKKVNFRFLDRSINRKIDLSKDWLSDPIDGSTDPSPSRYSQLSISDPSQDSFRQHEHAGMHCKSINTVKLVLVTPSLRFDLVTPP
jgi:hypothetical protein